MPTRRIGRTRGTRRPLPEGFGVVWTTVVIDLVGFGMVLPILPLYARRFHTTTLEATALVAAFSAASFVASPIWGRVSDRVGRKPVLLVSLVGTAIGSLLTGLAGGLFLLLVGRLVDGASGASVSVAQAAVADLAVPEDRPRCFGLLGAAFGIGFVAGPALGALAALAGPRVPFLVAAAIAGANALVGVRRLPSPARPPSSREPDPTPAPRSPAVVALAAVGFAAVTAFSAFEATFALFGHRHLGIGIGSSAGVFAAIGVVIVVVQGGLVRPVVRALGDVPTLRLGLVVDGGGLVLLGVGHTWATTAPALVLLTVGQGLVSTSLSTVLAGAAPRARRGAAFGVQQSATGLARVAGPLMGGALLGPAASGAPYLTGAGLIAVALVVLALGGSSLVVGPTSH